MKKINWVYVLGLLPVSAFAATEASDPILHYKNQRGSILEITLHETEKNSGTVTGTFKSAVAGAGKNCQKMIGKPVPAVGFYTGNTMSISISYPSCSSSGALVGNVDKHQNFDAIWIAQKQGQGDATQDWNTRLIGNDNFVLAR